MTVSASTGRQWTINQIITRSWRYAGLLDTSSQPRTHEFNHGRELLEDILDALATEGHFARMVDFYEQTLTSGTFKYTMPANVIDLVNPAMYIDPTNADTSKADGETVIEIIRREEWQQYSTKSAQGRPYKCYPHRVADLLEARLWPVPNEAGTVRFQIHRKLTDADDGNATFDLDNYWMDYIKTALAHQIAESQSMSHDKIVRLSQEAKEKLRKAKAKANQRPSTLARMTHRTGWFSCG